MKLLRLFIFILFSFTLYESINCLLDLDRITEHDGAFIGMFVSVIGCGISFINPMLDPK